MIFSAITPPVKIVSTRCRSYSFDLRKSTFRAANRPQETAETPFLISFSVLYQTHLAWLY